MKYPYTISAKLAQFPYRWHWKHGRFIRFLAFTLVGVSPLIITIHKAGMVLLYFCTAVN